MSLSLTKLVTWRGTIVEEICYLEGERGVWGAGPAALPDSQGLGGALVACLHLSWSWETRVDRLVWSREPVHAAGGAAAAGAAGFKSSERGQQRCRAWTAGQPRAPRGLHRARGAPAVPVSLLAPLG